MNNPLFIGPSEHQRLMELRTRANAAPVDMVELVQRLKTPEGKAAHRKQMTAQTCLLPASYMVTFSIETGHPCGTCRHMSMSTHHKLRLPNARAVWMVAEVLGFTDTLESCVTYREELEGHGEAVNVIQPLIHEASKQ